MEPLTRGQCHRGKYIYTYTETSLQYSIMISRSSVSLEPAASSNMRIMYAIMTKWFILTLALLINTAIEESLAQYVPPTPSVEPLYPKGLRMSIPGE